MTAGASRGARLRRVGVGALIASSTAAAVAAATSSAWAAPAHAATIMACACVLAALAPLVGVAVHRPADRRLWLGVSVMLGLWSGNATTSAAGGPPWLSTVLVCAGQAVAGLLALAVARAHRRARPAPAAPVSTTAPTAPRTVRAPAARLLRRWRSDGDGLLLAGVLALVLAHQGAGLLHTPVDQRSWVQGVPALDVLLAAVLVRFLVSRAALPRATVLVMAASLVTIAYDLLVTATGRREVAADDPLNAVYVLAAALFAAASLHPTVALPLSQALSRRRRSQSARLMGLVPLAGVPVGLFALSLTTGRDALPAWAYVAAEACIAAAALVKAANGVRAGERSSSHDALTGLANRRGLTRAVEEVQAHPCTELHLVLLDVRGFARINDTYGHAGGDALLVQVASRLQRAPGPRTATTTRSHESGRAPVAVARTGADHFAVLMPAPAPRDAGACFETCVQTWLETVFTPAFSVAGRAVAVGVRAGTVAVPVGTSAATALADAEVALHAAKSVGSPPGPPAGTAVVAYAPALREAVQRRLRLAQDLQRVLDTNPDGALREGADGEPGSDLGADAPCGRLVVHYQPLVELAPAVPASPHVLDVGPVVVGVEALVRWEHPQHGLVAPDDFLGIAEDYSLAARLDLWVLRTALADLALWDRARPRRLFLSTNLGRSSMLAPDLQAQVSAALAETGITADRLHLEITEHDALPVDAGTEALAALALQGVHVSLDDFGIGYTSLEYLLRYPVSLLKLDRSLTRALQHDDGSSLIDGVLALAGALQIPVLAEGVETLQQQHRLAGAGVRYGQGYLFSRPVPAHELAGLLGAVAAEA